VAGKSIPDEKFGAKKATIFLAGKSDLKFGFIEAAYYFNYLKIGNCNSEIAHFWINYIDERKSLLESDHEDMGMAHVFKAHLLIQIDAVF